MKCPPFALVTPTRYDVVGPCTHRAPTTMILVPGPFGAMHLFERKGAAVPRPGRVLTDAGQLRDVLRASLPLGPVVLCGSRHLDAVVRAADDLADVYVVPLHWLRSSRGDLRRMAALAARFVTAHRRQPIDVVYRREQYGFPF